MGMAEKVQNGVMNPMAIPFRAAVTGDPPIHRRTRSTPSLR